jgi:hypothetical protein
MPRSENFPIPLTEVSLSVPYLVINLSKSLRIDYKSVQINIRYPAILGFCDLPFFAKPARRSPKNGLCSLPFPCGLGDNGGALEKHRTAKACQIEDHRDADSR